MSAESPERHQDFVEMAVGQKCVAVEFSGGSRITFEFENGLSLMFPDGFCYTDIDDDGTSSRKYEAKRVEAPP